MQVRIGDSVFLCNTDEGSILQLSYPTMKLVRECVATLYIRDSGQWGECTAKRIMHHPVGLHQYPPLPLQVRTMPLFTRLQHVNTLAPLRLGELWAVLHNMGKVSGPKRVWAR